jgi:hypothetical protein
LRRLVEILPNETTNTLIGFLDRAVAWFAERASPSKRVMTGSGAPCRSIKWRSGARTTSAPSAPALLGIHT